MGGGVVGTVFFFFFVVDVDVTVGVSTAGVPLLFRGATIRVSSTSSSTSS